MNALLHNIEVIKSKTKSRIYAVVKANAYGHGLAVTTFMQPYVDGFCVATPKEAQQLAELAIYKPILILGAFEKEFAFLPYENVIYTVESLSDVMAVAAHSNKLKFFIKVNTGMNRLGCNEQEFEKIMNYVRHNSLNCEGAYTHFRNADTDYESAAIQYTEFKRILSGYNLKYTHCCASSALYLKEQYHEDIARVGLSVYGYNPNLDGLTPVMKVCTPILQIRNVNKGDNIGYGSYKADKDCRIAVVRGGYGDGYRRKNIEKRRVSVNGKICEIAGQICMDMCMVDISDVNAKVGDDVYLLGEGISAYELAKNYSTIVYEVLTSFNDRVERVYVKDKE